MVDVQQLQSKEMHSVTGCPNSLAAARRSCQNLKRIVDMRLGGFAVTPQLQRSELPLAKPLVAGGAGGRATGCAAVCAAGCVADSLVLVGTIYATTIVDKEER